MTKLEKVLNSVPKFESKKQESVSKVDKICQSVLKTEKVWQSMQNLRKHEKVWKIWGCVPNAEKVWKSVKKLRGVPNAEKVS